MGGRAMTTAAKAVVLGGYRTAVTTARRASRSFNATVSAAAAPPGDGLPLVNVLSCENDPTDMLAIPDLQSPAWEIDDWIFAGEEEEEEEEELLHPMYPAPRHLFGTVPTLEEAKAATAELQEAVEKVYFSSGYLSDSIVDDVEDSVQSPACLESSVTEGCTKGENSAIASTPNHAIQMFSFLQGNPEAQNVVASIASDENVWNAVMNNPKVKEFYGTQQSIAFPSETVVEPIKSSESSEAHSSQDSSQSSRNRFMEFIQNFKLKVLKMVTKLSSLFRAFMGTLNGGPPEPLDDLLSISFVALGIATIVVILLKRG